MAMCDGAGNESWAYDVMGRVLTDRRTTNGVTRDFTYAYNLEGSLWKLTYPSGRIITYGYNAAARLTAAQDVAGGVNYATAASYTPGGALASLSNGASLVSIYFYNSRLQPCRISVKASGTAPTGCDDLTQTGNVLDFRYGFNLGAANNGNVASIENRRDTGRSQSFTYDELNRLRDFSYGPCANQYTADVWGNLTKMLALPGSGKPTCDYLDQSATQKNQFAGFSYDAAGNLQSYAGDSYVFDAENRLTTVAGVTYSYDGDGRRVKKSNGTLYWYGTNVLDPVMETDLSGNNAEEFIFFNGRRAARRDAAGAISYFFADHLGSSRVVTNATGTIVEDSDFYPFGGERVFTDTLADQNYKFTSKERDYESASQLDYFVARHYAWRLGRFLQPDEFAGGPVDAFSSNDPLPPGPLPYADITNPQSLNKYTYVLNNPLVFVDPDGHDQMIYKRNPDGTITISSPFGGFPSPDEIQAGLDAAGFAPPPVGPLADGANAGISFARGKRGEALINLAAMIPILGDALKGARVGGKAFEAALAGGRHAGFLKNYATKSLGEIQSGIKSIEKQISEHVEKIANPEKYIKDWKKLDPREQKGLIDKWKKDIKRQEEQRDILKGLEAAQT